MIFYDIDCCMWLAEVRANEKVAIPKESTKMGWGNKKDVEGLG